ncbi:hypothetical protein Fifi067_00032 [Erwinia phage Fifi067]|nr:hypothetical protein Fifi067_00032 [Erwinia phage Fifi067]
MQVTLNQQEIETALKTYINDQITIKDGMEITIDLKAGRGPEGFSANIDIAPPKTPVKGQAAAAAKPTPAVAKPVVKQEPKPETQTNNTVVAGAATNAGDVKPETQPEVNEQEQQTEVKDEADAQAEQQVEVQEEVQAEAKPRASLFGGLKKPTN